MFTTVVRSFYRDSGCQNAKSIKMNHTFFCTVNLQRDSAVLDINNKEVQSPFPQSLWMAADFPVPEFCPQIGSK